MFVIEPIECAVSGAYIHFAAVGVILQVNPPTINVIEPDDGATYNATVCFSANVREGLDRSAIFELNRVYPNTTATLGVDYYPDFDSSLIEIPMGFSGFFETCRRFVIRGDSQIENQQEQIVYETTALNMFDNVTDNQFVIIIYDLGGKNDTVYYLCYN